MLGLSLSLTAQRGGGIAFLTLPSGSDFVSVNVTSGTITVTIAGHPVSAYNGEYTIDAADVTGDDSTIYGGPGFYVLRDGLGDPIGPSVYGETTDPADIARAHIIALVDPAVYAAAGRVPVLTGVWELDGVAMSGGDIDTRADADAGVYTIKSLLTKPDGTILEIESAGHTVAPAVPWAGVSEITHAWDAKQSGTITLSPDVQQWDDAIGAADISAPGTQPLYSATAVGGTGPAVMAATAGTGYLRAGGLSVTGSAFCLIVVAKLTANMDYAVALTDSIKGTVLATILSSSAGKWRTQIRDDGNFSFNIDTGTGPDVTDWAIVTLRADGTAWSLRVNGVELGTSTVGSGNFDSDQIGVLGRYDGGLPAAAGSGVALGMLAASAPLTLVQVQTLEANAEAYLGLSVLP